MLRTAARSGRSGGDSRAATRSSAQPPTGIALADRWSRFPAERGAGRCRERAGHAEGLGNRKPCRRAAWPDAYGVGQGVHGGRRWTGRRAGLSGQSGCTWVKRFNEGGLAVLADAPRGGRPPTHGPEVRSRLVSLATQKPRSLGFPFELWTLERLQREFEEREGVHLSDSTIWTWLRDEGLHWKRQQSWFHDAEQHDPEFVEKRGPSSRCTPPHQPDAA